MSFRHLAEGAVTEVEGATLVMRPGDSTLLEKPGETVLFEGAPIEDMIVGIDLGYELVLNRRPMLPQQFERQRVNRHTEVFHACCRPHVASAQQRSRHVDQGQHSQ